MRWSERPPAVRSHFEWLGRLRSGPRSLPVAVAHLVLVRPMHPSRSTVVAILGVLISTLAVAHGGTRSEPSLSRTPVLQPSGEDRALYERKLLVTKADLVRYVFLTNSPYVGDHAFEIYQTRNADKASPTGYMVTAMVTPSDSELGANPRHVVARRYDAALPAETATSVHELWSTVLARTGYNRGSILCGPMGIFSVVSTSGVRFTAVTIAFDEDSLAHAMLELGEQLIDYPQLAPNRRPAAAPQYPGTQLSTATASQTR